MSQTPNDAVCYEQRLVCFFDILGWKDHVEKAGTDPQKIKHLTFLPKLLTSTEITDLNSSNSRLTSFSDCSVVSYKVGEVDMNTFISGLAQLFLGAASNGFYLRAGVTIGDIYHDKNMVFGPALNRAYELESTGGFPRIIVDKDVLELAGLDYVKEEDGTFFVDPFEYALLNEVANRSDTLTLLSRAEGMIYNNICSLQAPVGAINRAKSPSPLEKLNWLHLRVRRLIQRVMNQDL